MENTILLDVLGILAIGLLVLANGFFVAAEFSLVSVRRTRIAELVARGESGAEAVQKAINNPDRVIAATQLGITLSSLALGWVGEPALAHLIAPVVTLFPTGLQPEVSHSISVAVAFTAITFLHVVVGELAPKSIALQDPERTSLIVAQPTLLTEQIFKPAIWALNGTGNALLRLVGVQPASGHQLAHSVEELKMLVTASAEGGVVEAEESEMLHAIFDFGEMVVRQVMVPRTEMIAIEANTPLPQVINLVTQSIYTKFPVYEDNLDQIVGIMHVKDMLNAMQSPDYQSATPRDMAREVLYVPETLHVSALLRYFRDNRQHIAIVLDEYGGTAGLATLEDLLEEIVGEVSDPFDESTPEIEFLQDGSALIDGLTLIEDVNEQLKLDLQDPDYDTIAGYVLGKLGRIPRANDTVEGGGVRIGVKEMDGLRIARVALERLESPASQRTAEDSPDKPAKAHS
ncbi:MAG: HlyC/CorC family transporter [Anaerolineales bacterium]|nr:HlyC/CorC family transporter [Anaerolineales bacterium]